VSFFFDLGCPLSYLAAERIERTFGEVRWVPVGSAMLRPVRGERGEACDRGAAEIAAVRARAEARARALRLPLVWPDRFPAEAPCALRAAAHACELGAGARFALAASRLAFCGGFDLDDPETLAEAAAAAGVPLDDCLAAAGDTGRDAQLRAVADGLRSRGVTELPAVCAGRRWFAGESGFIAACAVVREPRADRRPLAPAG
jgi:2-hydroxychromene-2-carboxylate isomerase